uniref:Uncharacterized protein n=1 Tax=Micrurus spixii TaxID=129469 RepID=A0A2D4MU06_9SAUR
MTIFFFFRNKVYIRFVVGKGLHMFKRLDACYEDLSLYSLDILYLERKILKTIIPLDRLIDRYVRVDNGFVTTIRCNFIEVINILIIPDLIQIQKNMQFE